VCLIAKRETALDTWWKLDSECDCKGNSTEQQCKDNNVIAKRKTGIGDRWKTRSQGDDLNVIARQKQNWRHGGN